MKKILLIMAALAFVLSSVNAMAATVTDSLTSTATVAANCNVQSVTNLDFGAYDPTNATADDDGVGNVQFRCTKGTAYGMYVTGAKTMTDGTDTMNFEIYQESGRTTAWPSVSPGVGSTAVDNTTIQNDIYGRIAALQDVQVGTYNGSVTVTIEY